MKRWLVNYAIKHYGMAEVQADTSDEAIEKMREQLRAEYEHSEYGYEVDEVLDEITGEEDEEEDEDDERCDHCLQSVRRHATTCSIAMSMSPDDRGVAQ